MSEIRDLIESLPDVDDFPGTVLAKPRGNPSDNREDGGDEIAAALHRQLDVLDGTVRLLLMQIQNLRAEVSLLDEPVVAPAPPEPRPEVKTTERGAVVEATLPQERQLPGFCGHLDALRVPTTEGYQIVCPDCDG